MAKNDSPDLRELLIDAHAHFFFLRGRDAARVKLWQILPDAIIIDKLVGAPMRKTILGYIPTIDATGVYEIEGEINPNPLPDQLPNTVRVEIRPSGIKRVNRRLYPRYNFAPLLGAKALEAGKKSPVPVRIVNLSAGGLRIESDTQLSPKSEYTFSLKIDFEEETHELSLKGTVLYELQSGNIYSYGIGFGEEARKGEATVEELDQTVDLLNLVNRLLVTES